MATGETGTGGTCPHCGHPGLHRAAADDSRACEDCDRCWADRQRHDRPPHHI